MDYFNASFDPIMALGGKVIRSSAMSNRDRKAVMDEFATIFYAEVLKQSFNTDPGIFSNEKNEFLPSVGMYRDVFYDKVVKEMISKGQFDAALARGIFPPEK